MTKAGTAYGVALAVCCGAAVFHACTSNPFGGNEISEGTREVKGKITLSDGADPEGAYVWLENFKLGAWTDASGAFQMTLPPPAAQGPPGGTSGIFSLFFYIANYELGEVRVATRNGVFLYDEGDLNKQGEVTPPVELRKLLTIRSTVSPQSLSRRSASAVDMEVAMQADSFKAVIVQFPKSFFSPYGTVILYDAAHDTTFLFGSVLNDGFRESRTIGHVEQVKRIRFSIVQDALPVGEYIVVPHMIVRYDALPPGMLESIAPDILDAGKSYLRMPFKRTDAVIRITE